MPEAGGPVTQVTTLPGVHTPYLAPDGGTLATIRSEDVTPPELYMLDAAGGQERRVTHSPTEDFAQYPWIRPRYVTFKSHTDGALLHGGLWEPANLDRTEEVRGDPRSGVFELGPQPVGRPRGMARAVQHASSNTS